MFGGRAHQRLICTPNMYEAVVDRNIAIATVEGESRRHNADQDPHDQAYALLPVAARRACNTASVVPSLSPAAGRHYDEVILH
jgi:hypothetical protein